MIRHGIQFDEAELAQFCRQHGIRRLALFGSILRPDFAEQSDIDLLVEFVPDHRPTLFGLVALELELTERFGRKVDLRTPEDLSPRFRSKVLATAEDCYAALEGSHSLGAHAGRRPAGKRFRFGEERDGVRDRPQAGLCRPLLPANHR